MLPAHFFSGNDSTIASINVTINFMNIGRGLRGLRGLENVSS